MTTTVNETNNRTATSPAQRVAPGDGGSPRLH